MSTVNCTFTDFANKRAYAVTRFCGIFATLQGFVQGGWGGGGGGGGGGGCIYPTPLDCGLSPLGYDENFILYVLDFQDLSFLSPFQLHYSYSQFEYARKLLVVYVQYKQHMVSLRMTQQRKKAQHLLQVQTVLLKKISHKMSPPST